MSPLSPQNFDPQLAKEAVSRSKKPTFMEEVKSFSISMFGHFLHLAAAWGPPLLVLYIFDRLGIGMVGVYIVVFVGLPWIFIVHYLTREWSNWGNK
jgi:hypothetical protein